MNFVLNDERLGTESMHAMLKDSFAATHDKVCSEHPDLVELSGATVVLVVHDRVSNILSFAHVGDCVASLGSVGDVGTEPFGVALTREHKPETREEKARIRGAGGMVRFDGFASHRVFKRGTLLPGLNMSRSIGDRMGQEVGMTYEPDVDDVCLGDQHKVLLLYSDGVSQFVDAQEAVDIVSAFEPSQAMAACARLADVAKERWVDAKACVDDITAIVVYL